jgi:hypothetical protein
MKTFRAVQERCVSLFEQNLDLAYATQDIAGLEKLYRQLQVLARSVGMQSGGLINVAGIDAHCHEQKSSNVIHRPAEPGFTGWNPPGAARRVSYAASRREQAPLRYPWGESPPVPAPESTLVRYSAKRQASSTSDEDPLYRRRRIGPIWTHGIPVPRPYWHRRRDYERMADLRERRIDEPAATPPPELAHARSADTARCEQE